SDSKARTTWTSASTPRRAGRSTRAAPSPLATPGMSTYSTVAGVFFLGWYISARASTRGSGTRAIPTRGSGRPPGAGGGAPVRREKSVLLPVEGRPMMPTFISLFSTLLACYLLATDLLRACHRLVTCYWLPYLVRGGTHASSAMGVRTVPTNVVCGYEPPLKP